MKCEMANQMIIKCPKMTFGTLQLIKQLFNSGRYHKTQHDLESCRPSSFSFRNTHKKVVTNTESKLLLSFAQLQRKDRQHLNNIQETHQIDIQQTSARNIFIYSNYCMLNTGVQILQCCFSCFYVTVKYILFVVFFLAFLLLGKRNHKTISILIKQ